MVQIMQMAKRYNQRPSEILKIDYDLLAFIIDEFAMYLESEITDDKGVIRWSRIGSKDKRMVSSKTTTNGEFLRFIQTRK